MFQGERVVNNAKQLSPVIHVDEDKCLNCHKCIAACPVKYCNDGSGDVVTVNHDLCIGCGECIDACTHDARLIVDDFDRFMQAINRREKLVAIVAPAIASNFPGKFLNFNGWLRSMGVSAIFDVSFGAELTVKSYLNYIETEQPKMVIAQPCPAIVTYIEIYRPELIPYLAPADSPMMHSIKQIREYYPQYSDHKVVIISPCIAKKREFDSVGLGDYNVTMINLQKYIDKNRIDISSYPATDFNNDPAERAVLFSTPGGLLRTAERELPEIVTMTRKIEGPKVIYPYLDGLHKQLKSGHHPLLIDCLNCEMGCNGGTGTDNREKHPDELEAIVEERKKDMQKIYQTENQVGQKPKKLKKVQKTVNRYWKKGLYNRSYSDRSANNFIKPLSNDELKDIYATMHKHEERDIKNCASCGYDHCEKMAVAVHYGLNKAENCHFFIQDVNEKETHLREELISQLNEEIGIITESIDSIYQRVNNLVDQIGQQFHLVGETNEVMTKNLEEIKSLAEQLKDHATDRLVTLTDQGGDKIKGLNDIMDDIFTITHEMNDMIGIIDDISGKTNMLSINAAIQSAHAGEHGKAFAVVARDIKILAENTSRNVDRISNSISNTNQRVDAAIDLSKQGGKVFDIIADEVKSVDDYLRGVEHNMQIMSSASDQTISALKHLASLSNGINRDSYEIRKSVEKISDSMNHLRNMSG